MIYSLLLFCNFVCRYCMEFVFFTKIIGPNNQNVLKCFYFASKQLTVLLFKITYYYLLTLSKVYYLLKTNKR